MHGPCQNSRHSRLANTYNCQTSMIFHGLLQLLLPLYFSIFPYCMTTQPTNKEGYPLGVGPKATTSLGDAPEVNYLRTSPDAAQTGRTI